MNEVNQSILNLEQYIAGKFKPRVSAIDYGLCDNVIHEELCVHKHFKTWEHFSGCCVCPIEGNMIKYMFNHRKNDRRTKYGKLRLNLAKHLLKELKKDVSNEQI